MNELIENIFRNFKVNGISVPVSFLRYEGDKTTYIVYMQTDALEALNGDDDLIAYIDYYDFDIYASKNGDFGGNYYGIVASVKQLMKQNGFVWQPERSSADMYENDTGYYHKTLSFAIARED